jgi:hypothetical protein
VPIRLHGEHERRFCNICETEHPLLISCHCIRPPAFNGPSFIFLAARIRHSTQALEPEASGAAHLEPQAVRRVYHSHQHVVAIGTVQNCSHRACIDCQRAYSTHAVACDAPNFCQCGIRNKDLLNKACGDVAPSKRSVTLLDMVLSS